MFHFVVFIDARVSIANGSDYAYNSTRATQLAVSKRMYCVRFYYTLITHGRVYNRYIRITFFYVVCCFFRMKFVSTSRNVTHIGQLQKYVCQVRTCTAVGITYTPHTDLACIYCFRLERNALDMPGKVTCLVGMSLRSYVLYR